MICIAAAGAIMALAADQFTLRWTHSVTRTTWEERWQADPEGLHPVEAFVVGPGAGVGFPTMPAASAMAGASASICRRKSRCFWPPRAPRTAAGPCAPGQSVTNWGAALRNRCACGRPGIAAILSQNDARGIRAVEDLPDGRCSGETLRGKDAQHLIDRIGGAGDQQPATGLRIAQQGAIQFGHIG